jgi:hypothetical protein
MMVATVSEEIETLTLILEEELHGCHANNPEDHRQRGPYVIPPNMSCGLSTPEPKAGCKYTGQGENEVGD